MTIAERIDQILAENGWPFELPEAVVESAGRVLLAAELAEAA